MRPAGRRVVLAAIPQPVVQRPRRHPAVAGEQLAGVHGAGADLDFHRAARFERDAGVDTFGELGRVGEHSIGAEHVGDEVVREDCERVDVGELGDAGVDEVVGGDLRALVEAGIGEDGMPAASERAKASADPSAAVMRSSAEPSPSQSPSCTSASA